MANETGAERFYMKHFDSKVNAGKKGLDAMFLFAEAYAQWKHNEGWQDAHDPRECGHPRACWQDRNYPASEQNYNPKTH